MKTLRPSEQGVGSNDTLAVSVIEQPEQSVWTNEPSFVSENCNNPNNPNKLRYKKLFLRYDFVRIPRRPRTDRQQCKPQPREAHNN